MEQTDISSQVLKCIENAYLTAPADTHPTIDGAEDGTRGFSLEYVTLGWNLIGVVILAIAAISLKSVALAGFGLDSLIEIGASSMGNTRVESSDSPCVRSPRCR